MPVPTHTHTLVSTSPRVTAAPQAPTHTPTPTSTPAPLARVDRVPGHLVLYAQGASLRSAPQRPLFDRPELQQLYHEHAPSDQLMLYLIGSAPIPSADGRYLVITSPLPSGPGGQGGSTWLGDLRTGELTALGQPELPATWSPDGRRLTYILDETLYVRDVAGGGAPVAIYQREGLRFRYARWSPTGQWIAVTSREGPRDRASAVGMWAYWLVSPDGDEVRELGTWLTAGMCAVPQLLDWSPDGGLLDTPSVIVLTLDGRSLSYDDVYEDPPPSAPARFDARFVDPDSIPDRRQAWMSHDEQRTAYVGHDGLRLHDRRTQTDVLIAPSDLVDPLTVRWSTDDSTLIVGVEERARGEEVSWGRILALKPEAGSVPELLAEGENVFLAGVLPDVLDEGRAAARPTVEVPLEETPEPAPTLWIPQPVPTQAVIQMPNLAYDGIRLTLNQPIAERVEAEIAPASFRGQLRIAPSHALFSFDGYILPDADYGAHIRVLPVAELEVGNPYAAQAIADLRQLLEERPAAPDQIPFLPSIHAGQLLRAQVAYIDFQGGSGVRFLTQYAQELLPINAEQLFYAFQGLTDEGHAYVSAILPVSHPSLPASWEAYRSHLGLLARFYDTYIATVEEQLNARDPSSFTPGLDRLDALIGSLEVGPRCPSVAPPLTETQEGPYQGWGKAAEEAYGFVLRYPPSWTLIRPADREAKLILLCQGDVRMTIAYHRRGEQVPPAWTGMPAGDFVERGMIPALGTEVVQRALVYEGKVKVLHYYTPATAASQAGDLVLYARLDDVVSLDYPAVEIPEALRDQADQIVGSLEGR
jgi:hypothetical protein